MKNILNYILKPTIVCLLFLSAACDTEREYIKEEKFIVRKFSMNEMAKKSDAKLTEAVNRAKNLRLEGPSENSKIIYDEKAGLYFDDEKGLYIEKDDKKSYTFPVIRFSVTEKVQNICFNKKENGDYDVYLVKYDYTIEEAESFSDEELKTRGKELIPLIKNGVELKFVRYVCVDAALYVTEEIAAPIDHGDLTGNNGNNFSTQTTVISISTSCFFASIDGNGGIYHGAPGSVPGGNVGGSPDTDNQVMTGSIISDTEAPAAGDISLVLALRYFEQGLEDFLLPVYRAHPEFREYLITNNCDSASRQFVILAISHLYSNPNITFDAIFYNKTEFDKETGDYNNNVEGNYDDTVYDNFDPQQNSWPTIAPIIPREDFIGWGSQGIRRNCMDYAKAQIATKGYQISNYGATGQTFQIYTEQNGVNTNELSKGLSYLTYALSKGIPVIVGVDDAPGSPNPGTDNTTDHFIVIVGMGTDSNGRYFTFYDNASGSESQGAHQANRLYYNPVTGIISGQSNTSYANGAGMHQYIVTQIRKSKPL